MADQEVAAIDPSTAIIDAVERTIALAGTWLVWDGRPRLAEGGDRLYTPHKAIRRMADHLLDHLAETEAILAGQTAVPDGWRGSMVTLATDWAVFTEADLNEARERLRRLASLFEHRLTAAGPQEWDRPRVGHWTLREIAVHVGSPWYAEQVGDLRSLPGEAPPS